MKTIAIVSLKGGVGRTTLTANLGAALAERPERRIAIVDLDGRSQLGLHLGLLPDTLGLAHASLCGVSWERVLHRTPSELGCLPFGALAPREEEAFAALALKTPKLLETGLTTLAADYDLVLLDTAPPPAPLTLRALGLADRVLAVVWPDPASFATLPALAQLLGRERAGRASADLLLNFVDGARLTQDVRAVLGDTPGLSLLPFAIHRDAAVPEALGRQQPLLASAPGSQAAEDFRRAAEWLIDVIDRPEEVSRPEAPPIAFTEATARGAD